MVNRIAYINGSFLEERYASLQVSDLSIQRGYGVFDYCRTSRNVPVHLEDHLDRFLRSAEIMHLDLPIERGELASAIHELIRKNDIPQSGIRMLLTGGYSPDSYEIIKPNLLILQHPLILRTSTGFETGIKVITHEYVREFPGAKTINYSMGIWLQKKIRQQNAVDVLYHIEGEISEFPRSNFFLVTENGVVRTPQKNVLPGITRKKILELGSKELVIEEGVVTLNDIRTAREAFMTSTTKRILPIIQVDNVTIGNGQPGQITQRIDELLVMEENLIVQ